MDGFNEKKWFVYLTDHHEGPFSLAELQSKLQERQITAASFAWCEGMPDWLPMTQIPECESILKPSPTPPPLAAAPGESSVPELLLSASAGPSVTDPASDAPVLVERNTAEIIAPTGGLELKVTEPAQIGQAIGAPFGEEGGPAEMSSPSLVPLATASPGDTTLGGLRADIGKPGDAFPAIEEESVAPSGAPRRGGILVLTSFLISLGVAGFAWTQGYLDPFLHSPEVRGKLDSARDFAQPYLLKLGERIPAVGRWVSPIPPLQDVSPEDYEELSLAARSSNNPANLSVAVAASNQDQSAPFFYVASFLPDGAELELYVEGIPETLLNHLSFRQKLKVNLAKRLGKSEPLRFGDNPIPRGRYRITVMEAETQAPEVAVLLSNSPGTGVVAAPYLPKGRKLIAVKTYFLGGAEDETYQARLKEFHDKLRERAGTELSEINQFAATLENQLSSSILKFNELRKVRKLTPMQKRTWDTFRAGWVQLSQQLSGSFSKWTPEALQRDYYYGSLYKLTRDAGQAVARLHEMHHLYFTGKVLPKAFDIQVGEAESTAQNTLSVLKAKIEQAQSMATSHVIPKREGL